MEMHVFAIDVSYSINDLDKYIPYCKDLVKSYNSNPHTVILWAENAFYYNLNDTTELNDIRNLKNGLYRCTWPSTFISLLPTQKKFHLHIVTDGKIFQKEVDQCKNLLEAYNLLKNILSVKLYYMGNKMKMNLKLIDIFPSHMISVQLNGKNFGTSDPKMDLKDFNYEDIMIMDPSFITWVLRKINACRSDVEKTQLRRGITEKMNEFIRKKHIETSVEHMETSALEKYYNENNIKDCVEFVKMHRYNKSKATIQSKISHILKLFDGTISPYSLDAIEVTEETDPLEFLDKDLEESKVSCDILYSKCKTVSFPVRKGKKILWTDDEVKKMARNPFNALKFIEQALYLVEPYMVDYSCAKQIAKSNSPFTREDLQGYYVLHNEAIDFKSLIKHNNYILSSLFINKLPGVKIFWHVVFLYVLATKKEQFSEHKDLLFNEIRYLSEHGKYYVTLNPFEEPTFFEKLKICFWYTAEICHLAFPNCKKNKYKSWENIIPFLQFYRDVFNPTIELPLNTDEWRLWQYFCSSSFDLTNLLAHFYGYKYYPNQEQTVLFHDLKVTRPIKPLEWLQGIEYDTVIKIYNIYRTRRNKLSYEDFKTNEESNLFKLKLYDAYTKDQLKSLSHVSINLTTCRPYVYCKCTKRYWKECVGQYDIESESSIRLFQRYCEKMHAYPESAIDLVIYKKNRLMCVNPNTYPVLHSIEERCFKIVMKIFKKVMKYLSVEEYLARYKKYISEKSRLNCE